MVGILSLVRASGINTYAGAATFGQRGTIAANGTRIAAGYADGSSAAAGGTAQLPTILNGYALRPPWNVAGVDYAVGPHSGTSFTSIASSQPANTTYNGSYLRINANNVTIDGYDFTVNSGIMLYNFDDYTGLVVRNCKFGGSNYNNLSTGPLHLVGAPVTVEYCTIDGGSTGGSQATLFFLNNSTTGLATFRYNWLKNFNQHVVESLKAVTLDFRFNLIDDAPNQNATSHYNCIQWGGGLIDATWAFNTVYQTTANAQAGEMVQGYCNDASPGGTMHSPNFSNNVLIAKNAGTASYLMHGSGSGTGVTNLTGTPICSENYFDPTGTISGDPFYQGSATFSGWTATSPNKNMVTGSTVTLF